MTKLKEDLVFAPLGGCGEIGMNLNLYGFGKPGARQWIMVDCGVSFHDPAAPGTNAVMADPSFIIERKERLLGLVLTHAHEDHMGAVADLWPYLECPVYATPFTAWLLRDRLKESGLVDEVEIREIPLKGHFDLGPFSLDFLSLTHSIPEPNALVIRTALGLVVHTGDWNLDPQPLIGQPADEEALKKLGDEGVLALVCDSTNVLSSKTSSSEAGVREELIRRVGQYEGRVAIASFASNVARLQSAMIAAKTHGRSVCLVGRSMKRMIRAAQETGLLRDLPDMVDEETSASLPRHKILYLCTGSQGEPRAALARIAAGSHRFVSFEAGDTILFSSKIIPGNDLAIMRLYNRFVDKGVQLVTAQDAPIHLSGHPYRDALERIYTWTRPTISLPVHGERRHLIAHADYATLWGAQHALAPRNGEVIRLAPVEGEPQKLERVAHGRLYRDGKLLLKREAKTAHERYKLSESGHVSLVLLLDGEGDLVEGPHIRTHGLPDSFSCDLDDFVEDMADRLEQVLGHMKKDMRLDPDRAEPKLERAVRRFCETRWGKKPLVDAFVMQV